jgi:tRNA pseudouridine13 synthase
MAEAGNLGAGVRIEMFRPSINAVRLGDNTGNRFGIVLRDLQAGESETGPRLERLTETGFLNCFGMQRFGIGFVPTGHVGIMI